MSGMPLSPLRECVPNFSAGRDRATVDMLCHTVSAAGVALLDTHVDAHYNRCVLTFAGKFEKLAAAALGLVEAATSNIDMTKHSGAHPRLGAADVFPFVPEAGPRPLMVAYTATRWKHLLDPDKMPPGEKPLSARDCYRYSLSHSAVDMVLCGPASTEQMREAILALERGPLEADERERIERIGAYLYARYAPSHPDAGDAEDVSKGLAAQ